MLNENYAKHKFASNITQKLSERILQEENNAFPQDVLLETTTFCNLKCIMCSNSKISRPKGQMRWPLYIKLIDELADTAAEKVRLWLCFYGEPFMGKDLLDRVVFAKSKGIRNVVINSNMNLSNPQLAEELVKAGLNTVFVGLDAASQDVYSNIRCGGDYDRVVRNVLDYKDALSKYGNNEQQIIVQFVDMPENHHQIEDVKSFWHDHGVTVKIRPLVTWQDTNHIAAQDPDAVNTQIKGIDRLPCHWLLNIMPITVDGKSVYCGCDYDGNGICGDLNHTTIAELWNTVKKQHRLIQLEGRWSELPEFCHNCGDWRGAYAQYV